MTSIIINQVNPQGRNASLIYKHPNDSTKTLKDLKKYIENKWNIPAESQILKQAESNDRQEKKEYAPTDTPLVTLQDDHRALNTFPDQATIKLTSIDLNDSMNSSMENSFTINNYMNETEDSQTDLTINKSNEFESVIDNSNISNEDSKRSKNMGQMNQSLINNKQMHQLKEMKLIDENEVNPAMKIVEDSDELLLSDQDPIEDADSLVSKVIQQGLSQDSINIYIKDDNVNGITEQLKKVCNFVLEMKKFQDQHQDLRSFDNVIEANLGNILRNTSPKVMNEFLQINLTVEQVYQHFEKQFKYWENDSWRYIHSACMHKSINILQFFKDKLNFDLELLEVKTNNDWCPLLLAVRSESLEVAKQLLDIGVNINSYSHKVGNSLHIAVQQKNQDLIELLLKQNINTSVLDGNKKMAKDQTTDELYLEMLNSHNPKHPIKEESIDNTIQKKGILQYLGPFLQQRERVFILNFKACTLTRYHTESDVTNNKFSKCLKISLFQNISWQNPLYAREGWQQIKLIMSGDTLVMAVCKQRSQLGEWLLAIQQCINNYKKKEQNFLTRMSIVNNGGVPEVKESEKAKDWTKNTSTNKSKKSEDNSNNENNNNENDFNIEDNNNNDTLQDFKIERKIGSGSFGKVQLVTNKNTHLQFALKILNKKQLYNRNQIKQAISECNILKNCKFQFITRLQNAQQSDNNLQLVMDQCAGGDLSTHLVRREHLSEAESKFFMCEIILAIEQIHSKNVVQRDMKPENILLDSNAHVKLADFGLSKENISTNDLAHSFCGSPAQLCPEMIEKKGVSKAADVWGLGTLLQELLNGRPPFLADNIQQMFRKIASEKISMDYPVSEDCQDFVESLLHKDPKLRFEGSIDKVKQHRWFNDINWDHVLNMKQKSPLLDDIKSNL